MTLSSALARTLLFGPTWDDEREADRAAGEVMRDAQGSYACTPAARAGSGDVEGPLPGGVRAFMEPRFGADFGDVRVHTGPRAARMCRALGARAFAYGADVYYGEGLAPGVDALTAHELAHVVQQRGRTPVVAPQVQIWQFTGSDATAARQKAFERRAEIMNRLNAVSTATLYYLVQVASGNFEMRGFTMDGISMTRFDKLMLDFVTRTDQIIPLRLVDGSDFVSDGSGNMVAICQDQFLSGKVDIDDLLADDTWGFQAALVHLLTERYAAPAYKDHLDDETYLLPRYVNAHFAARDKEGALYQYLFRDTTIVAPHNMLTDRSKPYTIVFTSRNGYSVVEQIDRPSDAVTGLRTWVQKNPLTRVSVDDFINERATAAAPVPP